MYDDHRRTFPPVPPAEGDEGRFAASWWGNAWVEALEDSALDPARLARGRAYAARGHVDAVTVTPGRVTAYVHGTRPRPYRADIRLGVLGDDDWERFLDSAAALCYQVARLLDEDPFVLFLLRGRGEQEILAALGRRNAALEAAESAAGGLAGPSAAPETAALPAYAVLTSVPPAPLPPPLPLPEHPGRPPVYPEDPGAPDVLALELLATEAAVRAHARLATGRDPVAGLTVWQDAVRLAAAHPGSGLTAATRALYRDLADALDRTPADLARAVAAWRQGGLPGLAALEEAWDPPAGPFDRARPLLIAAGLPLFRPWRNRLSTPAVQLRYGRDGRWYGYESDPGREDWWPRGAPDADPIGALADVLEH
ncbi:hypothetical protein C6N75_21415 [Streptomyces solincola]|uniref:Uncharacterized protein n=2 Tax=Streptomyces solincola TaxID=2100817 RepID=A0A2S9PS29_9ACTN|nr:hypothetical protein [Streptomyces solincola]PRH77226.1 hypothetical protein C6N75_21415 [Streptomyces solincola]